MKHLDCVLLLVRDQGVGGSNPLSPTILSLDFSIAYPNAGARNNFGDYFENREVLFSYAEDRWILLYSSIFRRSIL